MNKYFEIQNPKKVNKCTSSNCFQYQNDGDYDIGIIDTVCTGEKCENIFEKEIDESTMKSNSDIMDKIMLNDEYNHSCRTSSNAKNKY